MDLFQSEFVRIVFVVFVVLVLVIIFGTRLYKFFAELWKGYDDEKKAKKDDELPYYNFIFGKLLAKFFFIIVIFSFLYDSQTPIYNLLNSLLKGLFAHVDVKFEFVEYRSGFFDEIIDPYFIIVLAIFSMVSFVKFSIKMVAQEKKGVKELQERLAVYMREND